MAMKSAAAVLFSRSSLTRVMERGSPSPVSSSLFTRHFSDGKGRVLSEEERAKETVYIQKMEKERLEKLRLKAEKEKAEKDKAPADKTSEGETHKG